jgi:SAM-dependent methyltransferase
MTEHPAVFAPDYFGFVRREIAPLLPDRAEQALEVGCGRGGTLAWLKRSGIAVRITGIERDPGAAAVARARVDRLIEGDAEAALARLVPASLDLVLCLDVLEHLVDPWRAMGYIAKALRPGGSVVLSVPNIRHYSVSLPLVCRGRWQYEEAGILDRTHLRFFTRRGAADLIAGAGLVSDGQLDTGLQAGRRRELWKPLLARTPLRDLAVFQFLLRGRKPTPAGAPARAFTPVGSLVAA